MSSVKIISQKKFNEMCPDGEPDNLWDCKSYVDIKKLKNGLKNDLPKGARINKIYVYLEWSRYFKNIKNIAIPYENPVLSLKTYDGAYFKDGDWVVDYPVGDAIIVINK